MHTETQLALNNLIEAIKQHNDAWYVWNVAYEGYDSNIVQAFRDAKNTKAENEWWDKIRIQKENRTPEQIKNDKSVELVKARFRDNRKKVEQDAHEYLAYCIRKFECEGSPWQLYGNSFGPNS